jgi:serine/threonine protein kinase
MRLMRDMLRGLKFVHDKGQCHRDIKPPNVFLTRGPSNAKLDLIAKLGDFGLAKEGKKEEESKFTQGIGSEDYWSPERHDEKPYGWPDDVFALGIIMFELLAKKKPFRPNKVDSKGPRAPLPEWVEPRMKDLCMRLLEVDIYKRPSCEEALKALEEMGFN